MVQITGQCSDHRHVGTPVDPCTCADWLLPAQGGANYLGDKANEAKESAKGSADKAKAEAR